MNRKRFGQMLLSGLGAVLLTGCTKLSQEEAQAGLDLAVSYGKAMTLAGETLEFSEQFSMGGATDDAVAELVAYYESQVTCAEVTVQRSTLTINFGATSERCQLHGKTIRGRHEVTIDETAPNRLQVSHVWTGLDNGDVSVSGTATVTWSRGDGLERHVQSAFTWTRKEDGSTGRCTSDRVQRPLPDAPADGFVASGEAECTDSEGDWSLSLEDVAMRFVDRVPDAGTYVLATPSGKALTLVFERTARDSVSVTASGPRYSHVFDEPTSD